MELRITNPQESWLTEQILWNNEELKAAIAEKVKDYKTIAYTEDSLKDMKADRADLNKLKKAFEDERKRVKKICMEPYTKFEQQVKEITALIDEPIGLIDSQIREIDERRKAAKREEIEELFASIGFQSFVKLDMIWDEKWLNATVTLPKIEEQMKSRMYQIGTDVVTISKLPEFKFEAMEVYRKTLDMNQARPCTGQRRKCLHTLRSILLRFTKTVEQNLWNYWNRARFRKRICGSILHSGLRILTEWH